MSTSIYGSDFTRPEKITARHQLHEPFTLRSLGTRALEHVVSAGGQMARTAAAATEKVKGYAGTQWHALFQEIPDNSWPNAQAGRHTAALQGTPISDRPPVYADISMLDLMLSEPYQQPRLERVEHHFVDGMLNAYETTLAVGRMALQRARHLTSVK